MSVQAALQARADAGTGTDTGAIGLISDFVKNRDEQLTNARVGVAAQFGLMFGISLITLVGFSLLRPHQNRVYAPKIKYQQKQIQENPDYLEPPPVIKPGFFDWFKVLWSIKEPQLLHNIGVDATVFLRFVRMLMWIFGCTSVLGVILIILYAVYNIKNPNTYSKTSLTILTSANVKGPFLWATLTMSYLITAIVMFFVWRNWTAVIRLRKQWLHSPAYQDKVYARTLMITRVPGKYRSDDGLWNLMGKLKVDGIKIHDSIDCATIGRKLGDFPHLVDEHNEAVSDLEKTLIKYLGNHKQNRRRPTLRRGAFNFLGLKCGGQKVDAIDYYAKQINFLRTQIDERRKQIHMMIKKEKKERKEGMMGVRGWHSRTQGESYGFITFKTVAEAHRIARQHSGKLKELDGARLHLAPPPRDILWKNLSKNPSDIASARVWGFFLIALVCFLNTIPLTIVAALANLSALTWVPFIRDWNTVSSWSLSMVSGILPASLQGFFGFILPYIIRRISKNQGFPTRTRLERALIARYFAFMVVSSLVILVLLSLVFNLILSLVGEIKLHKSVTEVLKLLGSLPNEIQQAYVTFSNYWLTWLPLRGFLMFFELIQLIKLAYVSWRHLMLKCTPREFRELTRPPSFEYGIVVVNLLFIGAVGFVYAPLAPLVAIGAFGAFCCSYMVYKYQVLYVYVTKAESGGRMWNVYVNRIFVGVIIMQLLVALTMGLVRERWWDAIAAAPAVPILLGFKAYLHYQVEPRFRYYNPTREEIQMQNLKAKSAKRIDSSDIERRFLNPALSKNKIYNVEVHKEQEAAARKLLEPYPWFAEQHEKGAVKIKAIREENLEFDPTRDMQDDWETKSIASTAAFSKLDMNMTGNNHYDMHGGAPLTYTNSVQSFQPMFDQSTDHLLGGDISRSDLYGGAMPNYPRRDSEDRPLLVGENLPYPPTMYPTRPPMPHRGTGSNSSAGGSRPSMENLNPRNRGSVGSSLNMYGSRNPSVGNSIEAFGGYRPGSSASNLNAYDQNTPPFRSREPSVGNALDAYGRVAPPMHSRDLSGGSGGGMSRPRAPSGGNLMDMPRPHGAGGPGGNMGMAGVQPGMVMPQPHPGNAPPYGSRQGTPSNAPTAQILDAYSHPPPLNTNNTNRQPPRGAPPYGSYRP